MNICRGVGSTLERFPSWIRLSSFPPACQEHIHTVRAEELVDTVQGKLAKGGLRTG